MTRGIVNGHSMIYRWAGRTDVLMAHYNVAPATHEGWTYPPFAAETIGAGYDRLARGPRSWSGTSPNATSP